MAGTTVRRKRANSRCVRIVIIVAVIVVAFFLWKIHDLKMRNTDLIAAKTAVEERIALEQERNEALNTQETKELNTDAVIQAAREKYGLVFPDEIIFIPEE